MSAGITRSWLPAETSVSMVSSESGTAAVTWTVPSVTVSVSSPLSCVLTWPEVPRIPITMVEV